MRLSKQIVLAAALALSACGGVQTRHGAAEGVREFFVAVQTNDRDAFEAHIDRDALRESLKTELRASASGCEGELLDRLLTGGGGDALLDAMITPQSFKLAAERSGAAMRRTPSAVEVAAMLKMEGEDRACLRNPGQDACVMTFERAGEVWKLVALQGSQVQVRASDSASG